MPKFAILKAYKKKERFSFSGPSLFGIIKNALGVQK